MMFIRPPSYPNEIFMGRQVLGKLWKPHSNQQTSLARVCATFDMCASAIDAITNTSPPPTPQCVMVMHQTGALSRIDHDDADTDDSDHFVHTCSRLALHKRARTIHGFGSCARLLTTRKKRSEICLNRA